MVAASGGGGYLLKRIKKKRIKKHPKEASKAPLSDPMMEYHSGGLVWSLGGLRGGARFFSFFPHHGGVAGEYEYGSGVSDLWGVFAMGDFGMLSRLARVALSCMTYRAVRSHIY